MSTRTPAAGTSFVGDAKQPFRSASVVPSGSTTPFTPVSAPSPGGSLGFYGAINPTQPSAGPPAPSSHSPVEVWTSDFSRFPSSQPSGANPATLPRPFTGDLLEGLVYARLSGRDVVGECRFNLLLLLLIGDASSREECHRQGSFARSPRPRREVQIHLRRPDEAQRIYLELNSLDVQGRYRPLFEECNALVCEDVDPDDIVDSKNLDDKDGRFYLAGKQRDRVEYVTEGMEGLVVAMLRLEGENRFWKVDHAESLTKALSGASSRGMISDAYRTVQYRVAKASTLIHQRLALHGGYTYPRSVRSTASDFSNDLATSVTKRAMVDKWLKQPDIFPNLTPEYQAVVQRRLSDSRENEDPASLAQVPPELRFKILPGSLLANSVILNASMTQDYDATGAGSLASPERVEQELTHGVSQSTAEPSVPPKGSLEFDYRLRPSIPVLATCKGLAMGTPRSSYSLQANDSARPVPGTSVNQSNRSTRRKRILRLPVSTVFGSDLQGRATILRPSPPRPFSRFARLVRRSSRTRRVYPNGAPPSVAQPSQAIPSASTNAASIKDTGTFLLISLNLMSLRKPLKGRTVIITMSINPTLPLCDAPGALVLPPITRLATPETRTRAVARHSEDLQAAEAAAVEVAAVVVDPTTTRTVEVPPVEVPPMEVPPVEVPLPTEATPTGSSPATSPPSSYTTLQPLAS
ncbi:uncharacterized protein B0H18DRAFT_1129646 [Fomitopsis serialis]|uniref:uncharacterized protein n=1 Tax=Fomitopsis serialis TaxID=139415 RepID=UPI0020078489|nr:uncharacterized protein B0H18DRAFT_1129646 [Neoantrodia serialis]KAH9910719.1 hypothetical protein B0H18DRAFT_1129646 [Neoantrodia serialis]